MNLLLSDILTLLTASGILVLVFRIINHITK